MKQAYYAAPISDFLIRSSETVLGHLAKSHPHELNPLQRNAWLEQITVLQHELRNKPGGWLALEFSIPRIESESMRL